MNAAAKRRLKPLIDEAKRNPRVRVALWKGGKVVVENKTIYYGRNPHIVRERTRVEGTLVPVECSRPRKKPVKPKQIKRRKPKPMFKLGYEQLEQRPPEIKPGKWYVRFGYTSEGGEVLYVDEGPMAYGTAYAMANAHGGSYFKEGEDKAPANARKVVLPSQKISAKWKVK